MWSWFIPCLPMKKMLKNYGWSRLCVFLGCSEGEKLCDLWRCKISISRLKSSFLSSLVLWAGFFNVGEGSFINGLMCILSLFSGCFGWGKFLPVFCTARSAFVYPYILCGRLGPHFLMINTFCLFIEK